ncbi:hypothetical protein [uncultured Treponema sp.]|nr:hypothetical protein [uncultured Treponema sp.]
MNKSYQIPDLPLSFNFESVAIFKQLTLASRALAELKENHLIEKYVPKVI